jgi:hypothetical protein
VALLRDSPKTWRLLGKDRPHQSIRTWHFWAVALHLVTGAPTAATAILAAVLAGQLTTPMFCGPPARLCVAVLAALLPTRPMALQARNPLVAEAQPKQAQHPVKAVTA